MPDAPFDARPPPRSVRVRIEVPRLGFVKREADRVSYVSPVSCPFNYGSVPGTLAPDGDALDALVLGPRLAVGAEVEVPVRAVVRFLDAGEVDDKLVCGPPPTPGALRGIAAFFRVYAVARRWMNRAKGRHGETRFLGVDALGAAERPSAGAA